MDYKSFEITAVQRILAWQVAQTLGFKDEADAKDHAILLLVDYDTNTVYPQMIGKHFDVPHFSSVNPSPWGDLVESIIARHIVEENKDEVRAFWSRDLVRNKFAKGQYFDSLDYRSFVDDMRKWTHVVQYLLEDPDNGHLLCYCWVIEIDNFRKNQSAIAYLAEHDPLTGLYNRHKLDRSSLGEGVYIVLDVNDFKQINDTYGHHAGDLALMALADKLIEVFCQEKGRSVFRLGGDEFMVAMEHAREEQAIVCLDQLKEPLFVTADDGEDFAITVAAGYAVGSDATSALAAADKALYEVKHGREKRGFTRG